MKMTTAQVVEMSVTVNNNSPIQDYVNPNDQTQPTFEKDYHKEQSMANSNTFKIAQKIAFEAKGRLHTTGKVIQRSFIIDLYTYLAIYRYRWGKR